ncbi:MAG: hypothetical protein KJ587_14460, partial [Alphaproteobacteria bacterium]|nr:hypothetical protein [Alphaproteobacteria bacterium]
PTNTEIKSLHPTAPSNPCAALVVIDRIKWSPCTGMHGRLHRNAQVDLPQPERQAEAGFLT